MSKKNYVLLVISLIFIFIIVGGLSSIHYVLTYHKNSWFENYSEDGNYSVIGKEVGSRLLPMGYFDIGISVYDYKNHQELAYFETKFPNQSYGLTENQYNVEYTDKYIKISLIDEYEGAFATYYIYFEDYD